MKSVQTDNRPIAMVLQHFDSDGTVSHLGHVKIFLAFLGLNNGDKS